jgi:hypothetical protein
MASTYVNNLRLNELGTGDGSGTWGTTTNTNLELIGEAFGFGTEAITTNADTHTTTVADGSSDAGRAMYLKYTGTLDSACTITIAPNTMKRMQFIENGTSGSQNIIISQGSGANITISPGDTKAVYLDGAGSGAAVVDAFASLNVVDLTVQDDLIVNGDIDLEGSIDVNGTMEADAITLNGTAIGSIYSPIAGGTGILTTGALNSGSITSGFGTINNGSSTITTTGAISGGATTLSGLTYPTSDGSAGQFLKTDGSASLGFATVDTTTKLDDIATGDAASTLATSAGNITIDAQGNDTDIILKGTDGTTDTTFLTIDGSEAGLATFNAGAVFGGSVLPSTNDSYDLGSASYQFRDIYTGDINLNNTSTRNNEVDGTRGSFTIQEGAEDLFILNRLNGKKYKFKLEEII